MDTIAYDVKKIAAYQSNGSYDYLAQRNTVDLGLLDRIKWWFNDLMRSLFNTKIDENVTTMILVGFIALTLAAIIFIIYKRRPELFMRSRKTQSLPYETSEENIHEIDFETDIAAALSRSDYRLAVRLLYLQTLRFLSDNRCIDWQIHKTPSEYLYEIKDREMKSGLRELTNHFLQVRYGNYRASAELYETMQDIQGTIIKK